MHQLVVAASGMGISLTSVAVVAAPLWRVLIQPPDGVAFFMLL